MATSVNKIVSTILPAYVIDEYQNDETYWKIAYVGNSATYTTPALTFDYGSNTMSLNGTTFLTIAEGETITAIRLIYNDGGTDVIMDEQAVFEEFTYGGDYVVTDYTITLNV